MISISSLVICAWRVRFIWMVRALIMSPALRVALSIAVIWEAKKPAWFSSMAESSWTEMFCGSSACRMVVFVRLVFVERRRARASASTWRRDQLLHASGSGSPPT